MTALLAHLREIDLREKVDGALDTAGVMATTQAQTSRSEAWTLAIKSIDEKRKAILGRDDKRGNAS